MNFWDFVAIAVVAGAAVADWVFFAQKRRPRDAGWAAAWTVLAIGLTVITLGKGVG